MCSTRIVSYYIESVKYFGELLQQLSHKRNHLIFPLRVTFGNEKRECGESSWVYILAAPYSDLAQEPHVPAKVLGYLQLLS